MIDGFRKRITLIGWGLIVVGMVVIPFAPFWVGSAVISWS